jgi:hypothetical protein
MRLTRRRPTRDPRRRPDCFIFRDGNPNEAPASARAEMGDDEILETLAALRDRHGIASLRPSRKLE